MNVAEVSRVAREALMVALLVGGPILLVTATIGTLVSILQAVTQVHEQTLTFLPKLIGVAILLAVASGWMMQQMVDYSTRSFSHIADVRE